MDELLSKRAQTTIKNIIKFNEIKDRFAFLADLIVEKMEVRNWNIFLGN